MGIVSGEELQEGGWYFNGEGKKILRCWTKDGKLVKKEISDKEFYERERKAIGEEDIKEKVYCGKCKYYNRDGNYCVNSKCIPMRDTPLREIENTKNYLQINKNNDCKFYESIFLEPVIKEMSFKKGIAFHKFSFWDALCVVFSLFCIVLLVRAIYVLIGGL